MTVGVKVTLGHKRDGLKFCRLLVSTPSQEKRVY